MSAEAEAPASPEQAPATRRSRVVFRSVERFEPFRLAIALIIAGQAVFLGILMSRGWYYQADLANLAEATGKPLTWSYLRAPQGGHFVFPVRFIFWVLNRVAPLNYPLTIVIRLIGQAAATFLLARLLVLLVGRRRLVVVALVLYAFSPFLIQATLWLSASVGLIGAQLFLIEAIRHHVLYSVTRDIARAVSTAACILGATLLSEQAAVTVLALPILSLSYLSSGSLRNRLLTALGCWKEWLLIGLPMVGYIAYYFSGSGGYGVAAHPLGIGSALHVVRVELSATIAPGMIGGPWRWFGAGDNFLGLSDPSSVTQFLCGAAVLAVIALSVRATGWRALAAWSVPVVVAIVGILVVAVGRYETFGIVIAQQFEHAYYAALPAAVALCLAFGGPVPDDISARTSAPAARVRSGARAPSITRSWRSEWPRTRIVGAGVVAAVLISSTISAVTYAQLWARNPARTYVSTLQRSLHTAKAGTALYDTAVPIRIIPLEATHYVSDVVGLTDAHADFGYTALRPSLVDPSGRLVPSAFFTQTEVDLSAHAFCNFPVQRAVTVTKPFRRAQRTNDWYLQLGYFQQYASVLQVTLIDANGTEHFPTAGDREILPPGLGRIHLLFRHSRPVAVRIQAVSPATNLCITGAKLGFPFFVKAKATK